MSKRVLPAISIGLLTIQQICTVATAAPDPGREPGVSSTRIADDRLAKPGPKSAAKLPTKLPAKPPSKPPSKPLPESTTRRQTMPFSVLEQYCSPLELIRQSASDSKREETLLLSAIRLLRRQKPGQLAGKSNKKPDASVGTDDELLRGCFHRLALLYRQEYLRRVSAFLFERFLNVKDSKVSQDNALQARIYFDYGLILNELYSPELSREYMERARQTFVRLKLNKELGGTTIVMAAHAVEEERWDAALQLYRDSAEAFRTLKGNYTEATVKSYMCAGGIACQQGKFDIALDQLHKAASFAETDVTDMEVPSFGKDASAMYLRWLPQIYYQMAVVHFLREEYQACAADARQALHYANVDGARTAYSDSNVVDSHLHEVTDAETASKNENESVRKLGLISPLQLSFRRLVPPRPLDEGVPADEPVAPEFFPPIPFMPDFNIADFASRSKARVPDESNGAVVGARTDTEVNRLSSHFFNTGECISPLSKTRSRESRKGEKAREGRWRRTREECFDFAARVPLSARERVQGLSTQHEGSSMLPPEAVGGAPSVPDEECAGCDTGGNLIAQDSFNSTANWTGTQTTFLKGMKTTKKSPPKPVEKSMDAFERPWTRSDAITHLYRTGGIELKRRFPLPALMNRFLCSGNLITLTPSCERLLRMEALCMQRLASDDESIKRASSTDAVADMRIAMRSREYLPLDAGYISDVTAFASLSRSAALAAEKDCANATGVQPMCGTTCIVAVDGATVLESRTIVPSSDAAFDARCKEYAVNAVRSVLSTDMKGTVLKERRVIPLTFISDGKTPGLRVYFDAGTADVHANEGPSTLIDRRASLKGVTLESAFAGIFADSDRKRDFNIELQSDGSLAHVSAGPDSTTSGASSAPLDAFASQAFERVKSIFPLYPFPKIRPYGSGEPLLNVRSAWLPNHDLGEPRLNHHENKANAFAKAAWISAGLGDNRAAHEFESQLVVLDRNNFFQKLSPEPLLDAGRAFMKAGNFESAEKEFRQAAILFPSDEKAPALLADAIRAGGRSPYLPQTRIQIATQLKQSGDLEGAIFEYKIAIGIKDDPLLRCVLGDLYQAKMKDKEALDEYKLAVDLDPSPVSAEKAGDLSVKLGLLDSAKCAYDAALQKEENAELYMKLASVYSGLNQAILARQNYVKALEIEPFNDDALMGLVQSSSAMINEFPVASVSHFALAEAFELCGIRDQAKAEYEMANILSPDGKFEPANEMLARMSTSDGEDIMLTRYRRAGFLFHHKLFGQAAAAYAGIASASSSPGVASANWLAGLSYLRNGDNKEAVEHFRNALSTGVRGTDSSNAQIAAVVRLFHGQKSLNSVSSIVGAKHDTEFSAGLKLEHEGNLQGAVEAYKACVSSEPSNYVYAAQLQLATELLIAKLRDSVKQEFVSGNFTSAEAAQKRLTEISPLDSTEWFNLGCAAMRCGHYAAARAAFKQASALEHFEPDPFFWLARMDEQFDDVKSAIGNYERYVDVRAASALSDRARARIKSLKDGKAPMKLPQGESLIGLNRALTDLDTGLHVGHWGVAANGCERARAILPENAELVALSATIAGGLGDYPKELDDLKKAVSMEPGNNRFKALLDSDQTRDDWRRREQADRLTSEADELLNVDTSQTTAGAISRLVEAANLNRTNPIRWFTLGKVYAEHGKYADALTALSKCREVELASSKTSPGSQVSSEASSLLGTIDSTIELVKDWSRGRRREEPILRAGSGNYTGAQTLMGGGFESVVFPSLQDNGTSRAIASVHIDAPDLVARLMSPLPDLELHRAIAKQEDDVDFGPYMADLQRRLKKKWFPPKALFSAPSYKVVVLFKIHSDGHVSNLSVGTSSGAHVLDRCGVEAVMNAAPLRPLPAGAPENVDIAFTFTLTHSGSFDVLPSSYASRGIWRAIASSKPDIDDDLALALAGEPQGGIELVPPLPIPLQLDLPIDNKADSLSATQPLQGASGHPVSNKDLSPTISATAKALNNEAVLSGVNGLWEQSIRKHNEALLLSPDYAELRTNLCAAHMEYARALLKESIDGAIEQFRWSLLVDPANGSSRSDLENALRNQLGSKMDSADDVETNRILSRDGADLLLLPQAIVEEENALVKKGTAKDHYLLAKLLLDAGFIPEACYQFRAAIREFNRGEISAEVHRAKEEEADCHRSLASLFYEMAGRPSNKTNDELRRQCLENAAIEYRRAITLEPANQNAACGLLRVALDAVAQSPTVNNRFFLYAAYQLCHRYEKAREQLKLCMILAPRAAEIAAARKSLMFGLLTSGITSDATKDVLSEVEQMLRMSTRDAELLYLKGRALQQLSRESEALTAYRGAAELNVFVANDLRTRIVDLQRSFDGQQVH